MLMDKDTSNVVFLNRIIKSGTCTGCGLCVGIDLTRTAQMINTPKGPRPEFSPISKIPEIIKEACAGSKINYPKLYQTHFGSYPSNWLTGIIQNVYTGFSKVETVRRSSSSGGVLTQVLCYLLDEGLIDAAILVKQGQPTPENAGVFIARCADDIKSASQSIYIPVSNLDVLSKLIDNERYAITCLPEQSAAIRVLQQSGHKQANLIKYILGPYTGTALESESIQVFKSINGITKKDLVTSLKWRAGEWPGYLEIITESGRVVRSPKIYYNFLIPFFVAQLSLQSMDFANEFADLAVGDAWSPVFEKQGKGFSVVVSRNKEMDDILTQMASKGLLDLTKENISVAGEMHGHMIDFKKRGSFIRNQFRRLLGFNAPSYGYRPSNIPISRYIVEFVISTIFILGKTRLFRGILFILPESILGPLFNKTRLLWKNISKPTKRKGLMNFNVIID